MLKNFFLFILTLFICFIFAEVTLLFLFKEKASQQNQAVLNKPNLDISLNTKLLYKGSNKAPLRTNERGEILSGKTTNPELPNAYFIGGSTTQTVFVPEGKRWPDLIKGYNTHNYGVSGKSSTDSYLVIQHLLKEDLINNGDTIFLMHAVNDLRDLIEPHKRPENQETKSSFPLNLYTWKLFQKAVIKYQMQKQDSATAEEIYDQHKQRALKNKRENKLSEKEFDEFAKEKWSTKLKQRYSNLEKLYELCKKHDLNLILLTQPNCFLNECSEMEELKMYPILNEKNLDNKQTRFLLDEINEQTVSFAKDKNIIAIDLNGKFLEYKDPNRLFYDSVHYTQKGSKLVADIINKELQRIKSTEE